MTVKKAKRYQDGGITITPQQSPAPTLPGLSNYGASSNSYPFQSDASSGGGLMGSGMNQTFNIQPTAQTTQPQGFKRGGKISTASKRADGCAIRGKTKA